MTLWLSFVDLEAGTHLGCMLVEVDEPELDAMRAEIDVTHPQHMPGAEIVAAGVRKAWEAGVNPGGQVACSVLPTTSLVDPAFVRAPRLRLMQCPELLERGLI